MQRIDLLSSGGGGGDDGRYFLQGAILLCNPRYILQNGVYAAVSPPPQPLTGNARARPRDPASGRTKATAKDEKIVFLRGAVMQFASPANAGACSPT